MLWLGVALALAALAPVLWRHLRQERTPQSFALGAGSSGMDGRMWTRGQMLRHWLFWAMLPAILGPPAWNTAFFFHQVHIAEVTGSGHAALVALFPLYTVASIGSMLVAGWLWTAGAPGGSPGSTCFPRRQDTRSWRCPEGSRPARSASP